MQFWQSQKLAAISSIISSKLCKCCTTSFGDGTLTGDSQSESQSTNHTGVGGDLTTSSPRLDVSTTVSKTSTDEIALEGKCKDKVGDPEQTGLDETEPEQIGDAEKLPNLIDG